MIQNWRNSDTPPCTAGSLLCKNNRTAAAEGGKWLFFFFETDGNRKRLTRR